MSLLLILTFPFVYSCDQSCKLRCTFLFPSKSCLESCQCPLLTSSTSPSEYSVWNCSYALIDACNYSTDFNSCMNSFNCALIPSAELILRQTSPSSWSDINTLSLLPLKSNLKQKTKLVDCSDCKIFEGDDYWECISEYCKNLIKPAFTDLYEELKDLSQHLVVKRMGLDSGVCCAGCLEKQELIDRCFEECKVSECEGRQQLAFYNMKSLMQDGKVEKEKYEFKKNFVDYFAICTRNRCRKDDSSCLQSCIKEIREDSQNDELSVRVLESSFFNLFCCGTLILGVAGLFLTVQKSLSQSSQEYSRLR